MLATGIQSVNSYGVKKIVFFYIKDFTFLYPLSCLAPIYLSTKFVDKCVDGCWVIISFLFLFLCFSSVIDFFSA
ncbi:hypothetical protein FKN05_01575 [Vibrio sp. 1-1(7)]|nr:hypothetical protein [Vibrio sp. 1-1(7)]NNN71208.1 hypothetical protein [Vibrio sp. 12-2(3-a)]